MWSDYDIIKGCLKNKKKAQLALYNKYAPVLRGICFRYSYYKHDAEDILQEGFIKILSNIMRFEEKGSFEGWLKRIMVNTAITYYRRNIKNKFSYTIDEYEEKISVDDIEKDTLTEKDIIEEANLSKDELINIINDLPEGYKFVFNLYVLENYNHKEISETLNININTSKSQLSRARKLLQKKLYEYCINKKEQ